MAKILILYCTMTYNTEDAATALHKTLSADLIDMQFDLANARSFEPADLTQYPKVLFGIPTWDDNTNPDTEDFLHRLDKAGTDLSSVRFALFGLGDSSWPSFCGALPLVREALARHNAKIDNDDFKIDGYPTDPIIAELVAWAKQFLQKP
jgi:flavodoxin I